jgi:long-chain fatty acid transport protein
VTQDFGALGLPATAGLGLLASSGAGLSFRDVPASNGTTLTFQVLQIVVGTGIDLTDNLSVGAKFAMGSGTLDGPFVGITGAAFDYALRGSVGLGYDVGRDTTLGFSYETTQEFNFDDVVSLQLTAPPNITYDIVRDIPLGLPDNLGLGVANESLLDGRLLLAADVLFKQWDNTDLFGVLYENQWVFQLGAQYTHNRKTQFRLGYVYAENPIRDNPGGTAGGISPPGGQNAVYYLQSTVAIVNLHRFTFGFGRKDILPGLDMDLFAGFAPRASENFGAFTSANVEAYWIGTGLTWRFGRGACCRLPVPNDW